MNKDKILAILETAVDKNGNIPMRLVRQAFEKLPESCEDAVSRRDAIDAVEHITTSLSICVNTDEYHGMKRMQRRAVIELANLPSTQPNNIRCYECKHGIHSGCGDVYICHVSPELVMEHTGDFYCGYAERKDDERFN